MNLRERAKEIAEVLWVTANDFSEGRAEKDEEFILHALQEVRRETLEECLKISEENGATCTSATIENKLKEPHHEEKG